MAKRSENMLEAFKSSTSHAAEPTARPADSSGGAGGPFAPPAAPRASGSGEGLSLPVNPGGLAMMVGFVLLLAMAFLLGRLSAPSVQASAGDGDAGTAARALRSPALPERTDPQPGAAPAEPTTEVTEAETEADRAFLDPANRFTIRVLEYGRSERDQELAFAAYDHLRANGFPAVWPRHKGDSLFLFVGAAPSTVDLEDLLDELVRTPGPGRDAKAFESAFFVNIGDYL